MNDLPIIAKELSEWLINKELSNEECIIILKIVELGVTTSFISAAMKNED